MTQGVLRFFFDHGAGGCLWAGDADTRARFGVGPVDAACHGADGALAAPAPLPLSPAARALRDQLELWQASYLNPIYPLDPSLWTAALCGRFNAEADRLLTLLRAELVADFVIEDEQPRYVEDAALAEYLAQRPGLAAMRAFDEGPIGKA